MTRNDTMNTQAQALADEAKRRIDEWMGRYGPEFVQSGETMARQDIFDAVEALAALASKPDAASAVPEVLLTALRFYARGEHYILEDDKFDTVSDEPSNWQCHEDEGTMVEDGTIAKLALKGVAAQWIDGGEDETPQPIEGEAFAALAVQPQQPQQSTDSLGASPCGGPGSALQPPAAASAAIPGAEAMSREVRMAVMLAYGHLWHVNNEPAAPIPLYLPEKAANEARKQLRDLLTTQERGEAINQVGFLIGRYDAAQGDKS